MELTFREKRQEIADVWTFVFDPPEGLEWTPGQFLHYKLPHQNEDEKGNERYFTIASAPCEGHIQITTRMTGSSFKKALSEMKQGDTITAGEPEGDFTWPEGDDPTIFIAAGLGITPYRSMLKQRANDTDTIDVILIYSNRTNDVAFKDELEIWTAGHPELQVFYKIGVKLTSENLREIIPDIADKLVYLSGSEPMVKDLAEQLKGVGLPKKRIKLDEFPGYDETNY